MTSYVFQAFAPPFFSVPLTCNILVTSDVRSTVLLIQSFLISFRQSPEFGAISENCPHQRAHLTSFCRSLFIPLCLRSTLSLQIGTRSSIIFLAIPIRDLVSLLQMPSAHFSDLRYLKCSTASICSSSTITPASDSCFYYILTYPINLSS